MSECMCDVRQTAINCCVLMVLCKTVPIVRPRNSHRLTKVLAMQQIRSGSSFAKFVLSSLLAFATVLTVQGCAAKISGVDMCKSRGEQANDPEVLRQQWERTSSASTLSKEVVDSIIEAAANDPDMQSLEWIDCMTKLGALCYVDTGAEGAAMGFTDEMFITELTARGWEQPVKDSCFFEKTKAVVLNPFKA